MQILPEPVEAVLFDWDGTLADTVALVTAATNEVLIAAGWPREGGQAGRRAGLP